MLPLIAQRSKFSSVGHIDVDVVLNAVGHSRSFPCLKSKNVRTSGRIFYG